MISEPLLAKAISCTYRKLCNNLPDSFQKLWTHWQTDVGPIDDEEWQAALMSPREVAICHCFRLIQLKILHRTYMSGVLLAKIGSRADATCLRGCNQEGTFYHILWECPEIRPLWDTATRKMRDALVNRSCSHLNWVL